MLATLILNGLLPIFMPVVMPVDKGMRAFKTYKPTLETMNSKLVFERSWYPESSLSAPELIIEDQLPLLIHKPQLPLMHLFQNASPISEETAAITVANKDKAMKERATSLPYMPDWIPSRELPLMLLYQNASPVLAATTTVTNKGSILPIKGRTPMLYLNHESVQHVIESIDSEERCHGSNNLCYYFYKFLAEFDVNYITARDWFSATYFYITKPQPEAKPVNNNPPTSRLPFMRTVSEVYETYFAEAFKACKEKYVSTSERIYESVKATKESHAHEFEQIETHVRATWIGFLDALDAKLLAYKQQLATERQHMEPLHVPEGANSAFIQFKAQVRSHWIAFRAAQHATGSLPAQEQCKVEFQPLVLTKRVVRNYQCHEVPVAFHVPYGVDPLTQQAIERYEKYILWRFLHSVVLFISFLKLLWSVISHVNEQTLRRKQAAQREREQAALRALGVHGVFLKFFREQWPDESDPFIAKTAEGLYNHWLYCLQNRGPFLTILSEVMVYAEYLHWECTDIPTVQLGDLALELYYYMPVGTSKDVLAHES
jgi:hypothetical protein